MTTNAPSGRMGNARTGSGDRPSRVSRAGLTLIEMVIAMGLFGIIAYSIYASFANILDLSLNAKLVSAATRAIQGQIELMRNMSYSDIGIIGGWPPGKLPAATTTEWEGTPFLLTFIVRNIDDPFDGTLGGSPNDTAPADYRLVGIQASCPACGRFIPVVLTARVAPQGLETASQNGSLFVQVFDAGGVPIPGASVTVTNMSTSPTIQITDTTNVNGMLQLVDIPTSTSNYQVIVTKSGYSREATYSIGDPGNPNPVNTHATVAQNQLTQVSLAIDRTGSFTLMTADDRCAPVTDIGFLLAGAKLIGTAPDVVKFATSGETGATGTYAMNTLEWDAYTVTNADGAYAIAGRFGSNLTFTENPGSSTAMRWVMAPADPTALLVSVLDQNDQPLAEATATLTKAGFNASLTTGRRFLDETDWSGGGYAAKSSGMDAGVPGTVTLAVNASGTYAPFVTEWLESGTFDLGTSTATFDRIEWEPVAQPPTAGADSVRFQVAANTDSATWNYIGPDGTAASYFLAGAPITGLNGNRYFRYKIYLQTADELVAPAVDRVRVRFGSNCFPAGQAYFDGLAADDYTLTVSRGAFQTTSTLVTVGGGWQEQQVKLAPF